MGPEGPTEGGGAGREDLVTCSSLNQTKPLVSGAGTDTDSN